jgi:phospholipid N-methyltransferase
VGRAENVVFSAMLAKPPLTAPPSEDVFWRQVFQDPRKVGAIGPSSRELAKVVVESAGIETAQTIIELGPGGGVITEEILRRKPATASLLALENNPALIGPLRARFREAAFVETCASRLPEIFEERNIPSAESIISTLPWTLFRPELQSRIIAGVRQCLRPGGVFSIGVCYGIHLLPAGRALRTLLDAHFEKVTTSPIIFANMPPAFVYSCT